MNLLVEGMKFFAYAIIIVLVSKYLLIPVLRKIGELLNLKSKTIGNITGIATSIPELLTVSFSALSGLMATSAYNIISSNVINVVQYMFAIFFNKNHRQIGNKAIRIDLFLVCLTIVIPIFMMIFNIENSIAIVPIFIVFMFAFYKISNNAHKLYMVKMIENRNGVEKNEEIESIKAEEIDIVNHNGNITISGYTKRDVKAVVLQGIYLAIISVVLYVVGDLLGGVLNNLSEAFNIPEFILGVLLGFITSLPELITFFEAQRQDKEKHEGVVEATGNLLTSNIMNLFVVQTIGILVFSIFG